MLGCTHLGGGMVFVSGGVWAGSDLDFVGSV